ncbi:MULTISPECIES: helix-turn-helix domain-containing protein [Peribacillus]|uniref:helix-turn-helix domain-containing protein n=1 Tax=Peribacillus TaxID=2675229 RepID=UPI001F4DF907|nr:MULTISPECIES: helix-turn-helix transcriptional regulator [unclassified Peribacillus]MCK1982195.1 helix-turn-helix transcriptional regulator [Peribacillus sp. Aquil_B1]MCK2007453.1 helix-turn-helix transcriptional regulator [Peribacillus sp. Aquil_B8]
MNVNLKLLLVKNGYKSIMDFANQHDLSYMAVLKLANNQTKTFDKELLVTLCDKLNCGIGDLLHLKEDV